MCRLAVRRLPARVGGLPAERPALDTFITGPPATSTVIDRSKAAVRAFLEAERRFHAMVPVPDVYSMLFVRTLLWFTFFALLYTLVTAVV